MPPSDPFTRAVSLHRSGRLEEAVGLYRSVLARQPGHGGAALNLGVALHQQGHLAAAERQLRRLLEGASTNADVHAALGAVLRSAGRAGDAVACYRRALALRPDFPEAFNNLGNALKAQGRLEEALESYGQALRTRPDYADAYANMGGVLKDMGHLEEAMLTCRHALSLAPTQADAWHNLGSALMSLGRPAEAIDAFGQALTARPAHAEAQSDLAMALLLTGAFASGWHHYEARWAVPGMVAPSVAAPRWRGEDIAGRSLLVWAEQGLGDTIQFSRCLGPLAERGARTTLLVPEPLLGLWRDLPGVEAVLPLEAAPPECDVQVPLLSLPGLLGLRLDQPLAPVPPAADAVLEAEWRQRLGAGDRPRIGVVWAGNARHRNDRNRSLDPALLVPALASVDLYSLQVGPRAGDLAGLPAGWATDLSPYLTDFAQTAAALRLLDGVVCVDTAVAHLSASLGRPTWLCLPFAPDWRWQLDRADCPWYPSLRLFRQPSPGAWAEVVGQIATAWPGFLRQLTKS